MKPAIVIPCYRRTDSLRRLLTSLLAALYPNDGGVPLIISVDKSDDAGVADLAESCLWPHGEKRIIRHEVHLGLKNHILYCGDLTGQYHAVVVLEDDLLVSPHFYEYAMRSLLAYQAEDKIAGISLYSQMFNETAHRPFRPIDDGSDVYFLQLASSWGEAWTARQWGGFRGWLDTQDGRCEPDDDLPRNVQSWSAQSWKRPFNRYLIQQDRYFVYPRRSLVTNFSEVGEHVDSRWLVFQVPLLVSPMREVEFKDLDKSGAVYDAYHEIKPSCLIKYNISLGQYDFAVDLYASKNLDKIDSKYVLTTRRSSGPTILGFAGDLLPHDANVALNVVGNDIFLCATDSLKRKWTDKFHRVIDECVHDFPQLGWKRGIYYSGYLLVKLLLNAARSLISNLLNVFKKSTR